MHLERIELQGFKTFATRTVLELRPGVTAIVGPNGSGKSNIADAVRWALGETNLRQVRCRGTEELIFAGSGHRSSLGMAEVSLVFANEGGWLDLPFSEVRVSRRAYRSGENEYVLNGTRVRLRDVVDLLAGASIQAGSHVVIGQGLVDAALSQRAEERRLLVENLAGLKHYYLRRDDAETRLGATVENLAQVDSMIAELAPHVAALATQADALRAYRAAEAELRTLQRATLSAQAARAWAKQEETAAAWQRAAADLGAARTLVARMQGEIDALVAADGEARVHLEALQEQLRKDTATQVALRRDAAVAAARLTAATEAQRMAATELALLSGRVEQARAARQAAAETEMAAGAATRDAETATAEHRRLRLRLTQERDAALAAHRQAEAAALDAERTMTQIVNERTVLATRAEGLTAELQRQQSQLEAATRTLAAAEHGLAAATDAMQEAQQTHAAARAAEAEARARLESARQTEAAYAQAVQEARRHVHETATRRAVLQELQEQRDGYEAPARSLASHPAAIGLVAELISVPPDYQGALALALGPLLEAIVTADPGAIVAARNQHGTAGQLRLVVAAPDESGTDQRSSGQPGAPILHDLQHAGALAEEDVVGWAIDLIDVAPALARSLQLDRLLVVRDAAAVLRCREALRRAGTTVVAADGTLALAADESLVHGLPVRLTALLRRRHELEELHGQYDALIRVEAQAQAERDSALRELRHAEAALQAARQRLNDAEHAAARARDERRFQERIRAQAGQAVHEAQAQVARLRRDVDAQAQRHAALEQRLGAATERQRCTREGVVATRAALATAETDLSGATARFREAERAAADLHSRLVAARQLTQERAHALVSAEQDLARRAGSAEQAAGEVARLQVVERGLQARERAATEAVTAIEQAIEPVARQLHEIAGQQAALRERATVAADALAKAERNHERSRQAAEGARHEMALLRAQALAELGCTLEELPEAAPPADAAARMRALRDQLAACGPVNARAEEDYAALSERHTFLQTQAEDLRAGVARLRGIIADANATVRDRFGATVNDLHRHFTGFFERLFGGGACRLVATYDAQGLPSGMLIEAQPPGKRTRDLALLSGGERALVALALLFAMLKVRPVPFCLLDEVEAALDEANTGRFGAILRELSAETQFVLITHNRGTMLHADCLYGVTMSEAGISTMFTIQLTRDEAGQVTVERSGA